MTTSSAPGLLRKSGVSTSIVVCGEAARMARMTRAKCAAPPSSRSSLSTEVMTACFRPMRATASATRAGSSSSTGPGRPVATLQKAQARVQISPRIMKVAWRRVQHSPRFGQAASSQTVARPPSRTMRRVSANSFDTGARTRIHSGLRFTGLSGRWAFSGWRGRPS